MPNSMNKSIGINQPIWLRLFLFVFLTGFCILVNQAFSDTLRVDLENQTDELAKIKNELVEKRESLDQLHHKEKSVLEELLNLEERLDLAQRFRRQLKVKERNLEEELKIKEMSLGETDTRLILCRDRFQHRLREIYKHRNSDFYAIIFDASSPVDLVNRLNFIRLILKQDQALLTETKNAKAELEEKERNLRKTKEEWVELEKRKTEEEVTYQKELKEKEKLLKKIKSEKTVYAQAVGELEKSAMELENILASIQPEYRSAFGAGEQVLGRMKTDQREGLFFISKGRLPWPIQGKVVSRFGEQINPQFRTRLKNSGIEIEGAPGREVAAVSDGRVIYSSRLRGYGNLVILEHEGGYYTLYARLSEILVSPHQEVDRLQKIGVLGENGFSFGPPTLHFEIREGKQPQNPLEWLRE